MRGRGAGSADGRNGRREAVVTGVWVRPGEASVIACRARSAILTNRTPPLSNSEPEFSLREEEGISRVYRFLARRTVRILLFVRKACLR